MLAALRNPGSRTICAGRYTGIRYKPGEELAVVLCVLPHVTCAGTEAAWQQVYISQLAIECTIQHGIVKLTGLEVVLVSLVHVRPGREHIAILLVI